MKNRLITIICMLFLFVGCTSLQGKCAGGILYGENWACLVVPPENWIMDQKSFASYGIYGLFYEKDKTLGGDTPIIYINTSKLNSASNEELKQYISSDTSSYQNNGFSVKAYELKNIKDKQVFTYAFHKGNNFEICAYTRYKDVCFLVILTAHDEELINENISNLETVINNMQYMDALH